MEKLLVLLHKELKPYIVHYHIDDATIRTNIINDPKYKSFWEGKITSNMLNDIIWHCPYYGIRKLLHTYKIRYNVIIDNYKILTAICADSDINIMLQYKYTEKMQLIIALLNTDYIDNLNHMNIKLLTYLLTECDYTKDQWLHYVGKIRRFISNKKHKTARFITKYIEDLLLYNCSLRNTWILSCITYN